MAMLLTAATIAAPACDRDAPPMSTPAQPDTHGIAEHGSVVRIDPSTGEILAVVPVGEDPLLMEAASGYVWTLNLGDGSRTRIDPITNLAVTMGDREAVGMTSDGTDVWLAVDGSRLQRVDGPTGEVRGSFELSERPLFELRDAGFLAVAGGDVWITIPDLDHANAPQELWRLDRASGAVQARMRIGPNPFPFLANGRFVWIIQTASATGWLTRIDARTGGAVEVPTGSLPIGLAVGDGSLWIGDVGDENVRRIDPRTGETTATIPIDEEPRGIGFAEGTAWISTERGLVSIDADTNRVARTIDLIQPVPDEGPTVVTYAGGSIWVSIE